MTGRSEVEILQGFDEPDSREFPAQFSHSRYRDAFLRLAQAIQETFDAPCTIDTRVQDASHHGDIAIPAGSTVSGKSLIIRVSNFGSLVTVGAGGLARDSADAVSSLSASDEERILRVAMSLGFRVISGSTLRQRYTGLTEMDDWQSTWWYRFFDYT
ncbi:hypothetical protein [Streptomyces sp. NPDC054784]